ncbi:MAG: PaaI family thioesterase, partial [Oscillospiraceae bacterium]
GMTPQQLKDAINNQTNFMRYNHMVLTVLTPEIAVVTLTPCEHNRNIAGNVHGGALMALADSVAGSLARAAGCGPYVSLSGNLNFIKGVAEGEIAATATLLHGGRSTSVINVDITNCQNVLIAQGTFTLFRLGDWED